MSTKTSTLKGITIIHDQTNDKKYAQIDLELYGEYLEDLIDGLVAQTRKDEESIPLEEALKELKEEGLLGYEV